MSVAHCVSEIREGDPAPSCHVCGCEMTAAGTCSQLQIPHFFIDPPHCHDWQMKYWVCRSCGTTTECL